MNGVQRTGRCFTHAQGDLNRRILRMFVCTFSLVVAHILIHDEAGREPISGPTSFLSRMTVHEAGLNPQVFYFWSFKGGIYVAV